MDKRPIRKRTSSARKKSAAKNQKQTPESEEELAESEEQESKDADVPEKKESKTEEKVKEEISSAKDSGEKQTKGADKLSEKEEEPKEPTDEGSGLTAPKSSTGKKLAFLVGSLVIFGAAVLGGLYLKSGPQSHMGTAGEETGDSDPLFVETITITTSGTYESRRTYSGVIRAKKLLDLSFQASGRIDTILPETGDQVEEGVELAYFDNTDLQDTRDELDEKRADTQDDLDDLLDEGFSETSERIKGMESAIDDLEKKIDEIDDAIESRTLTAPFDGVIALKHVTEGAVVSPSVPVLRIMQEDNLEAWVAVPESIVSQLETNTDYELIVDGKTYQAPIDTILPEVDSRTRTRTVVFAMSEKDAREIATGASVELVLKQEIKSEGFWLPVKAMTREVRGLWSVYLVKKDEEGKESIARAYLEVIYLEGERAWVRGTVSDGDQVVIGDGDRVVGDGILRIVPGQRVTTSLEKESSEPEKGESDSETGKETGTPEVETNQESGDP